MFPINTSSKTTEIRQNIDHRISVIRFEKHLNLFPRTNTPTNKTNFIEGNFGM